MYAFLANCGSLKRPNSVVLLAVTVIFLGIAGCGTLKNGRGWGQDAIYPLELGRIPRAAYHAFFDLQTLIPAAGALAVIPFDHTVSNWATTHTPIFGSQSAAENATGSLQVPLRAEWILTALATPSGDNPEDWVYSKIKGIGSSGFPGKRYRIQRIS